MIRGGDALLGSRAMVLLNVTKKLIRVTPCQWNRYIT